MTRSASVLLCALLVASLPACDGNDDASAPRTPAVSTSASSEAPNSSTPSADDTAVLSAEVAGVVAGDLQVPWALAFLPDGSALVSERDSARITRVSADGNVASVGRVRGGRHGGEGGLLGIALSPSYDTDQLLFAYFTAGGENRIRSEEHTSELQS